MRLVEAITVIKKSKRHGCAPAVVASSLNLASDDAKLDNLEDFRRLDPFLCSALEKSESVRYDDDQGRFFFKFAQQFRSAYEFDLALKERSPVIIVDPEISYEGLMEHIEVRPINLWNCEGTCRLSTPHSCANAPQI